MTSSSVTFTSIALGLSRGVAEAQTILSVLKYEITSSALSVKFSWLSAITTLNRRPASNAFCTHSRKFVRSLSLSATLPFIVSFCQLMNTASPAAKPDVITSARFFVDAP